MDVDAVVVGGQPQRDVDVTDEAVVLGVQGCRLDVEVDVADGSGLAEQFDGVDPQRSKWVGHGASDQWS